MKRVEAMKPLIVDKKWITEHLPDYIPSELVNKYSLFQSYYLEGLKIICEGDRGGFSEVYEAKDDKDLQIWEFKHVCKNIALEMERRSRYMNTPKWRYTRAHVEHGKWMYFERENYVYNAIEDTRLYWFEEYLRLINPVLSSIQWNIEVKKHINLMNRLYKTDHWDYDYDKMVFVEISASRRYRSDFDDSEEPSPEQIINR